MCFGKDYIKIGKVLYGDFAIVHIQKDSISQVLMDLGLSKMAMVPTFLTLLGRPGVEAAGVAQIQNQPYLDLRGKGILVRIYRYGNRL